MNCVIDNPMCDGTSCANCQLKIVTKERDEARQDFRDILGKTNLATIAYYTKYRDWVHQEES